MEFRGCARPITEEFNLAGNYHAEDVLQAEFYRTAWEAQFLGGNILRLLRAQKKQDVAETTQHTFFHKRVGYAKRKEGFEASPEQKYGFRGKHPAFYYLSPWEFTQWWGCSRLQSPTTDPRTRWTPEGQAYKALNAGNKNAAAPRAKEHYVVIECQDAQKYITFPDRPETEDLRHHFVMVRRPVPCVPRPDSTPLPTSSLDAEQRGMEAKLCEAFLSNVEVLLM